MANLLPLILVDNDLHLDDYVMTQGIHQEQLLWLFAGKAFMELNTNYIKQSIVFLIFNQYSIRPYQKKKLNIYC